MEAESSRPADGKSSGRQEQALSAEPPPGPCPVQPPPHSPRPVQRGPGRPHHRQPRRGDLLLRLQQHQAPGSTAWHSSDAPGPSGGGHFPSPSPSSGSPIPSSSSSTSRGQQPQGLSTQASQEASEGAGQSRRGDKKPQKPGKYVCTYCGRPCAKPSVLQKHIRSHTGERPYPCVPCGFSFKTKSNLYKHRKSHAHRIKAGLASSRDEPSLSGPDAQGEDPEEPTEGESTDSEEETGQHRPSKERQAQQRSSSVEHGGTPEEGHRSEDSQAVKQRLAMRLSERKRGPMASPDDPPSSSSTSSSSLGPGSKGSTESGYFSSYGSAELSQVSPPSANAKTYAEIILGKYGRRSPHQLHPHHHPSSSSSGPEEKGMPFSVPKTQVIEHITKLITINEAVVDTSEIDSVKPRRSSLSRKSSLESPKFSSLPKDPYVFEAKDEAPGPSGVRGPYVPVEGPEGVQVPSTTVPLLRSHSMPSSASQGDLASCATPSRGHRLSQSFDEQQAVLAEMRVGHVQRMLKRQPAIEMPLGAELVLEEAGPSSSSSVPSPGSDLGRRRQQERGRGPWLYECEACGARGDQREDYEAHARLCPGQPVQEPEKKEAGGRAFREDRPQMMHYKFRALAMAVRKRRKEESLEEDPPSPCSPTAPTSVPSRLEQSQAFSGAPSQKEPQPQQQDRKGVSVIQHTSSFEKQESISMESQEVELKETQQTQPPEPKPSPTTSRLVRQHNIQVPEILVTVEPDADMPSVSPPATASSSKEVERVEEFQWPQRSHSLSQLPAEKLPPKKKRLRLAEAAQSSGESSFESMSLPRSPSQESSVSHTSSRSPSFEEQGKPEAGLWGSGSQASHMLTVPPASHPHHHPSREMRRSTSEQAPASPQSQSQITETRSKSFDYGCLSPQQSASAWRERRKCLLVKHATLGEPDQDDGGASVGQPARTGSPKPGPSYSSHPAFYPAEASTSRLSPEAIGKTLQLFQPRIMPIHQTLQPLRPPGSLAQLLPVTTAITEVLSTQIIHRAFLHTHTDPPSVHVHPAQLHVAERLGVPLHPFSDLIPLQFPTRVGASQAVYFPVPPGLTIQVPSHLPALREARPSTSSMSPSPSPHSLVALPHHHHPHHPMPTIATCMEQLMPVVSLVVPVRLQTHIPTYASAMYTTLSQILVRSQEPICCTAMVVFGQLEQDKLQRSYLKLPSPDLKSYLPVSLPLELAPGSGEDYGPLGAGGSKRMLSPAASLELSLEAKRQQKRVKEEEEREEEEEEEEKEEEEERVAEEENREGTGSKLETGDEEVATVKEEEEEEEEEEVVPKSGAVSREEELPGKSEPKKEEEKKVEVEKVEEEEGCQSVSVPQPRSPERPEPPSYPTLHTTTSVSWCYLNYVKPNPCPQREPQASVYSTWSVSVHNPNLPGLSTKQALSLLRSKQKHSAETYTTATATAPASSKLVPANSRTPRVSEVHAAAPGPSVEVKEPPQPEKGEKKKGRRDEEGASTSKQSKPPPPAPLRIFEGGYKSNEEYVYVRGRGRGKYVCGECGIRCKKPSMLRKHIRTHTDVRPYVCKHCNFAFKTKGNLTKHMKSKSHGKKCQAMGVPGSSMEDPESEAAGVGEDPLCGAELQEAHQFSDVDDSEEEEDDNEEDEEDEESSSHDDPPSSSCSSDTHPSTGGRSISSRHSKHGPPDISALSAPDQELPGLSPSPSHKPSPRRQWPRGHAASPCSKRALFPRRGWNTSTRAFSPSSGSCSPARSLSPRLDLSSPSQHPSPSPERGPSPGRTLSPLQPRSPSRYRTSPRARASPSPLGVQPRHPGCLPWESPGTIGSNTSQERCGTPQLVSPESCLFPPALRLSFSDSPGPPSPHPVTTCHVFSHLPMHSQQAKVPYLMIPIGGIQMVQARPCSHPTTHPSSSPLERPLLGLAWREAPWGGTPRTRGLRTPRDHWPENQEAGSSQSGQWISGAAPKRSKPESQTADTKQYGSSHSSSHTHRSATEHTEPWPLGSPLEPSPSQSDPCLSQGEEPLGLWPKAADPGLVEGELKGGASDSTNQSTY